MDNRDWSNIVKLKYLNNYLNNEELTQLSMISRKFRSYLLKDIVKCFNFSSFVDPRGYRSVVIAEKYNNFDQLSYHLSNPHLPLTSDLIESKNRFVQDIQVFKKNLKKIVVHNSIDYSYLLYELPAIFPDVTTLIITNSVLTIELLQYLLNNFKYLEKLDICENILIHNNADILIHDNEDMPIHGNEDIKEYNIEWPASLSSLKLCDNMVINVEDGDSNIVIRQVHYEDSRTFDFYPSSKHSPSLVTFEYNVPESYLNYKESYYYYETSQIQFFNLNTQLKTLKLSGNLFGYEILNIIKDHQNLTHLEYKCKYDDLYLDGGDDLVLPNVFHLHILSYFNWSYLLESMFPNVTDLVIEYNSASCQSIFQNDIENYPKIRRLKLISNNNSVIFNFTLPKLNYLQKLEINFNYEAAKIEDIKLDVSACDKLKLITITKNENFSPFEKTDLSQKLETHKNFYYFPYKLAFYRNPY